LTVADGFIADDAPLSPFDTNLPAIANLDVGLREAILSAATDAQAAGVEMVINSGWRSARYQQALLDEAVVTYGSEEEARKWVNTPDASTHVTGDAVDVGPTDAASWLSQYGSAYGLCQTYANELWHYELLVEPGGVCPAPIVDASAG
jgi:LAS superfamily LD-carboxypeptidase LdcB